VLDPWLNDMLQDRLSRLIVRIPRTTRSSMSLSPGTPLQTLASRPMSPSSTTIIQASVVISFVVEEVKIGVSGERHSLLESKARVP